MSESDDLRRLDVPGRIKALRERRGLSHDLYAEKLGTGRGTLIRWEKAISMPSEHYAKKLAKLENLPVEMFQGPRPRQIAERVSAVEVRLESVERDLRSVLDALRHGEASGR